eukprot:7294075-Alexandrium_andersonii.AAC.1
MPLVAGAVEGRAGARLGPPGTGRIARGGEPHWILDGANRSTSADCSRLASLCNGQIMHRLKSSQGLSVTAGVYVEAMHCDVVELQ